MQGQTDSRYDVLRNAPGLGLDSVLDVFDDHRASLVFLRSALDNDNIRPVGRRGARDLTRLSTQGGKLLGAHGFWGDYNWLEENGVIRSDYASRDVNHHIILLSDLEDGIPPVSLRMSVRGENYDTTQIVGYLSGAGNAFLHRLGRDTKRVSALDPSYVQDRS